MEFSIIVPVYNAEKYLQDCIASVSAQTVQSYEIILVDDGSTDQSGTICDLFQQADPNRIRVIHTPNRGALMARLSGIKAAEGDVLMFLDADDCLRLDALEIVGNWISEKDCDLICFSASGDESFQSKTLTTDCAVGAPREEICRALIMGRVPNSVCLKAVRKECVVRLEEITQFAGIAHGEDLLMSAWLIDHASRIAVVPDRLYFYRRHAGSITSTYEPALRVQIELVHRAMEKYIASWGIASVIPAQKARTVRSWVRTFLLLLRQKNRFSKKFFDNECNMMINNDYFREAFLQMDQQLLRKSERIVAAGMYYGHLRAICAAYQMKLSIGNLRNRFRK